MTEYKLNTMGYVYEPPFAFYPSKDGGWYMSWDNQWIPGTFESPEVAKQFFEQLDEETIVEIWRRKLASDDKVIRAADVTET